MDPLLPTAADWEYAAEGGKHALFRYGGAHPAFCGRVLRVPKDRLAAAAEQSAKSDGGDASTPGKGAALDVVEEPPSPLHAFQRDIVRPLIGEGYLDLPTWVRLLPSVCAELHHRAVASGSIPPSRLPSWRIDGNDEYAEVGGGVEATLLRDHTRLSQPSTSNAPVFSVEIKPKAGYIASSPLVLPAHQCKYFHTRYQLQQRLMQMGHVTKGWQQHASHSREGGTFVPSEYSPLDLFSGTMERIEKALRELSRNRQNNFRAWCDGKQIFGACDAPSEKECRDILNTIFGNSGSDALDVQPDSTSVLLDLITTTIANILDRESLLSNLLAGQQLDAIDGDGAVVVYERLVRSCGGSNVEAKRLLDETASVSTGSIPSGQNAASGDNRGFLGSSPYAMPECNSLSELLDETERFQPYLCDQRNKGTSPDVETMNASHAKCIELIIDLSKEACVYLLLNWLLSLVLCDVSFFVTFQLLPKEEGAEIDEAYQTCDSGGVLQMSCAEGTTRMVRYEVKVVDCDPKPAKKLRSRREVESKFGHIVV